MEKEIYDRLSKINPYNGNGLGESFKRFYFKVKKTVYYYFIPKFLSVSGDDKWVVSFKLEKSLIIGVTPQIYYDLVSLGIDSPEKRPKCSYCQKEARFEITKGYLNHCLEHSNKTGHEKLSKLFKGVPLSEEHRKKLSLAKRGKKLTEEQRKRRPRGYTFKLSKEAREKISLSKKEKVCSRSYYKSGTFISKKSNSEIKYLSSYERDFLNICENSKYIKQIEVPDPIKYKYIGEFHHYYPDFLITTDSGDKVIIEIKCFNLINDKKVIMKRLYSRRYCKNIGYKYITLTEKDIYYYNKKHLKKLLNKDLNIYEYFY